MPAYDAIRFDPPAPLAYVTLRRKTAAQQWSDVPMLLDSGADVTLLPSSVVDRLGVEVIPERRYELVGFDGLVSLAPAVQLELIFMGKTFRGQFLLIDQEWGIIGRNTLNAVTLLLDGPHLTWSEQSST
jgi:hypothetical protein